jgi:hypothetical protein
LAKKVGFLWLQVAKICRFLLILWFLDGGPWLRLRSLESFVWRLLLFWDSVLVLALSLSYPSWAKFLQQKTVAIFSGVFFFLFRFHFDFWSHFIFLITFQNQSRFFFSITLPFFLDFPSNSDFIQIHEDRFFFLLFP